MALMSTAETAEYLGLSKRTVEALAADRANNRMPVFKIGTGRTGRLRFDKAALDKWMRDSAKAGR